jgi:hypothetical protein
MIFPADTEFTDGIPCAETSGCHHNHRIAIDADIEKGGLQAGALLKLVFKPPSISRVRSCVLRLPSNLYHSLPGEDSNLL